MEFQCSMVSRIVLICFCLMLLFNFISNNGSKVLELKAGYHFLRKLSAIYTGQLR
jgi:hypothetical protein